MADKLSYTPEGIPMYFLKRVAPSISKILTYIFNHSLNSCTIPLQWKITIINPVFKKGSRSILLSYRPISLASCFSRVFENIICDKLFKHLNEFNLLSPCQFGFIP